MCHNANGYYLGTGIDLGFIVKNDSARAFDPYSLIDINFGNKVTMGMELRLGYEKTFESRLYFAIDLGVRFAFDVSGSGTSFQVGHIRSPSQPYIFTSISPKIGVALNQGLTKLYWFPSLGYMSAGLNISLPAGFDGGINEIGFVLLGTGLGIKQEVLSFMDVFLELRIMFDVYGHVDLSGDNPFSDSVHGSSGYQLLNLSFGVDFKF
jgi:hypothetical protein